MGLTAFRAYFKTQDVELLEKAVQSVLSREDYRFGNLKTIEIGNAYPMPSGWTVVETDPADFLFGWNDTRKQPRLVEVAEKMGKEACGLSIFDSCFVGVVESDGQGRSSVSGGDPSDQAYAEIEEEPDGNYLREGFRILPTLARLFGPQKCDDLQPERFVELVEEHLLGDHISFSQDFEMSSQAVSSQTIYFKPEVERSEEETALIFHPKFGEGTILSTIPGEKPKLVIQFQDRTRTLLASAVQKKDE